jgi:hypothetical protein
MDVDSPTSTKNTMDPPIPDETLPLKRGRKPKHSEVEFIIPVNIQFGLIVVSTPPLQKHTRRPPYVEEEN